ncbi:hypothetical protein Cflav_PD2460 [Pedosphaera parvula Ellin514]|uniref:Uncharacterized protein n=1 Tax=Pedosphaera parvula (strain Ellin514) TaxID=320771 RepID=B9XKR0_PEDPL|nr:hypothetical protein Cflav_PD2460 [Pedosphaera parvula Ellin514]
MLTEQCGCSDMRFFDKQSRIGKSILAFLLAGLVLLVGASAASSSLHKFLHSDAGSSDHECLITAFHKGKVSTAAAAPVQVSVETSVSWSLPVIETFVPASADYRFSSSRAPPSHPFSHLI